MHFEHSAHTKNGHTQNSLVCPLNIALYIGTVSSIGHRKLGTRKL